MTNDTEKIEANCKRWREDSLRFYQDKQTRLERQLEELKKQGATSGPIKAPTGFVYHSRLADCGADLADINKMTRVKVIREASGLTRKELCERYSIPYRTLQDWETGAHQPPAWAVKMLQELLLTK